MTDPFVWGPWAGMGRRSVPISIRQQRTGHRIRIALVVFSVIFVICCGLAGLSNWQGPQL